MKEDLFGDLSDEWWQDANEAVNWKLRFKCSTNLFEKCQKLDPDCDIKSNKKATKALNYLSDWLANEKHMFTRQKILQILTIIIPKTDATLWKKTHTKFSAAAMHQWLEKKISSLVIPILFSLWQSQSPLNSWTEAFDFGLTAPNPVVRINLWKFLTKCATEDPRKAKTEFKPLFENEKLFEMLLGDTEQKLPDFRKGAIECLACITILVKNKKYTKSINEKCETNPKLKTVLNEEKPRVKDLMKKFANLRKSQEGSSGGTGGGEDEKSNSGSLPPQQQQQYQTLSQPPQQQYQQPQQIQEIQQHQPPMQTIDDLYDIGKGGIVKPPIKRVTKNHYKAPKIKDGQSLEKFVKDSSISKIGKAPNLKPNDARKALASMCSDITVLDLSVKIGNRLPMVEELFESVGKKSSLTKLAEPLVFTIQAYMGWDGKDSRNPMLAKTSIQMLEWIFLKSKNLNPGLVGVVLPFLVEKMNDRKHGQPAANVLWAMSWQYSPKILLPRIFNKCLELPSEKHWTPVVIWIKQVIAEFGIHNCNPTQHLHFTHQLIQKAKQEPSKQACYAIIVEIYKQLGDSWQIACIGPLDGKLKKSLEDEMLKYKKEIGSIEQKRVVQGEKPPLPQGQLPQSSTSYANTNNNAIVTAQTPPRPVNVRTQQPKPIRQQQQQNIPGAVTTVRVVDNSGAVQDLQNQIGGLEDRIYQLESNNQQLNSQVVQLQSALKGLKAEIRAEFIEEKEKIEHKKAVATSQQNLEFFKVFIQNTVGLPQYLGKFQETDCADIRMIEHFDMSFLKNSIKIKNPIHLKLFVKYIKQFNAQSISFRKFIETSTSPKLKHYLQSFESSGTITWQILADEATTIEELQSKFNIQNVQHAQSLYSTLEKFRNGELEMES